MPAIQEQLCGRAEASLRAMRRWVAAALRQAFQEELGNGTDPTGAALRAFFKLRNKARHSRATSEKQNKAAGCIDPSRPCVQATTANPFQTRRTLRGGVRLVGVRGEGGALRDVTNLANMQMSCDVCQTTINGCRMQQDGLVVHFGCIDQSRPWVKAPAVNLLHWAMAPALAAADAAAPRTGCMLRKSPQSANGQRARGGLCDVTSRKTIHVCAMLLSGRHCDVPVVHGPQARISELRRQVATAMGRMTPHVALVHDARCLQGNWLIHEVFGDSTRVEIAAMVTSAARVEDVMDPSSCETEYAFDFYHKLKEDETGNAIAAGYLEWQAGINSKMRAILVDWLVAVEQKKRIGSETLFMAVLMIDRYLKKKQVSKGKLQLLGVTCMSIAAKYESRTTVVKNADWVYLTDNACNAQEMEECECRVMNVLDFKLCAPTASQFLSFYHAANLSDEKQTYLVQYILELALVSGPIMFDQSACYTSSHLAAASLYLSNKLLKRRPCWPEEMVAYTSYSEADLRPCAKVMCSMVERDRQGSTLKAVQKKFGVDKYARVSTMKF